MKSTYATADFYGVLLREFLSPSVSFADSSLVRGHQRRRTRDGRRREKGELLGTGQAFDGVLALERGRVIFAGFLIDKRQRCSATGVLRAPAIAVGGKAAVQIVGDAGIECAVLAAQDVKTPLPHSSMSIALRSVRIAVQRPETATWRGSFLYFSTSARVSKQATSAAS